MSYESYFGGDYSGDGFSGVGGGYSPEGFGGFQSSENGNSSTVNPNAVADPTDMAAVDKALAANGVKEPGSASLSFDKSQYASLSADEQQASNAAMGRPSWYDAASPGWREAVFDATNPKVGSDAYTAGVRGAGMSFDDLMRQESMSPGMQDARVSAAGNVINRMAQVAMPASVNAIATMVKAYEAYKQGMPLKDALAGVAFDIGTPHAVGAINKAAVGAMGKDAARALSQYNKGASIVNTLSPGTLPGVNIGASTVNAAKDAMGAPSFGKSLPGVTKPDGSTVNNAFGGFQSSSPAGDSGGQATGEDRQQRIEQARRALMGAAIYYRLKNRS